jgi:hypothetical protein
MVPVAGSASGADQVVLNVYKDNSLLVTQTGQASFSFQAEIPAGMSTYRVELKATKGSASPGSLTIDSVLCGDAYLVYGQSNAEAIWGADLYLYRSRWIRTYQGNSPEAAKWGVATPTWDSVTGNNFHIGTWALHMARQIVEKRKMPVAIINGAIGNTSIAELSPDAVYDTSNQDWIGETKGWGGNYYKRMIGYVRGAGLEKGVRALLWHQGEKQVYGADAAKGVFPYISYYQDFLNLRKSWYADIPGLKRIYIFQIKNGCGPSSVGWDVMYETQRKLAADLPDVEIMATLLPRISGCHYGEDGMPGYELLAEKMYAMIDKDLYGGTYAYPVRPPDLVAAAYTSKQKNEVVLQFDQNVAWENSCTIVDTTVDRLMIAALRQHHLGEQLFLKDLFAFDSTTLDQVTAGRSEGNKIFLTLSKASSFKKIAYPPYNYPDWKPCPRIGGVGNGLGALGFYAPIADTLPATVAVSRTEGERSRILRSHIGNRDQAELVDLSGRVVDGHAESLPGGIYFLRWREGGITRQERLLLPP